MIIGDTFEFKITAVGVSELLNVDKVQGVGLTLIESMYGKSFFELNFTDRDVAKWNKIAGEYQPVDYMQMTESSDGTNHTGEAACAGGACMI